MIVLEFARSITWKDATGKLRAYWTLIKSLQTGLLVITGIAGLASARNSLNAEMLFALIGSLFLAIGGSTVLNMLGDVDIDAKMKRTERRPLPTGRVTRGEALRLGLLLSAVGVGWAIALAPLYGGIVLAGLFFDVGVYTLWLKRRTPWSIVWGGISGGMPVLAGRALGMGALDTIGLMLALAVLLWIPTHIMTFSLRNADDYCLAGIPVFPNTYGPAATRLIIALSTAGAVVVMLGAEWLIGMAGMVWYAALGLGVVLVAFALAGMVRPSEKLARALYKLASFYMLGSMLLIVLGAL